MTPPGTGPPVGTARKLGVKTGMSLVAVDAPAGWGVPDLPEGAAIVRRRPGSGAALEGACVVVAFFRSAAALADGLEGLAAVVRPATALWVAWPRRAGGHTSDLTDNVVRDAALALGLVDNKVAAIDSDWSGLRFVWRRERRTGPAAPSRPG